MQKSSCLIGVFRALFIPFLLLAVVRGATAAEVNPLEKPLKAALMDAQKSLGSLEPWQKSIFTNDILPQYQKFIKDYSRSGVQLGAPGSPQAMKIDVDGDSLKRFLTFYAPKVLKRKSARALILLYPQSSCQKCVESVHELSDLVQAQIWRRGLTPNLVNPEDLKLPASELEIQNQVIALAQQRRADAVFVVQWGPAPVDDIDSAHVDEPRYVIRNFFKLGDESPFLKQRELLGNDSFTVSEASLLVDLFTELGESIEKERSQVSDPSIRQAEVLVEVSGIKSFAQLTRVKSQIKNLLRDNGSVEERKLSYGQASFAVNSSRSFEELKSLFQNANLDPSHNERLKVGVSQ